MRLNIVVLPAPLGPINPYRSPDSRDIFRFLTATRPPNRFVQFLTSRIAISFSKQSLRPIDHDQNEQDGEIDQPKRTKAAEDFKDDCYQGGANNCTFNTSE